MKLHLHCIQPDIAWEDKPANFRRVRELVLHAEPAESSLIILPEMFATGFSRDLSITAEPPDGPTTAFAIELASETQCAVMAGLVMKDQDRHFNVSLTVAPDGSTLCQYAKRFPFSLGEEDQVHAAGHETKSFTWRGVRIAPLICYDLRFPEVTRDAARLGVDLYVCIASWPVKRVQHWITLLQARAIENLAWVVGVNRAGTDPQFTYPGRSMVVDPHGVIVADASDREQVMTTIIDTEVSAAWRSQFPALRNAGLPD